MDWVALNSRSTPRHIMRPLSAEGKEECVRLKSEIIAATIAGEFVVDAFSTAAIANSVDETTRAEGGLLGTRLRQGVVTVPEIDRACFVSPLGRVSGPIASPMGYHLVLVEERIGLTMHDEGMSRVVARPRTSGREGVSSVLAPPDENDTPEGLEPSVLLNVLAFMLVSVAGGELLSQWASSIDLGAVASSVS